jgi:hypothetical protein
MWSCCPHRHVTFMVSYRCKLNIICAGVSEHVATEMPFVQVYQITWQLKYLLCRSFRPRGNWNAICESVRPRGNWNAPCAGLSEHVATEIPYVQMYQTTWHLKCLLCRCISLRGNRSTVYAGVSDNVAIEIPSTQVIRTRGNTFKTHTFTVSTLKHQNLWISISYRRSSCSSVNKKFGDGLCSLHWHYSRHVENFLFSTASKVSLGPILYGEYFLYFPDAGAAWGKKNLLSHNFEFRERGNIEFTAESLLLFSRVLKLIDIYVTDPTVIRP